MSVQQSTSVRPIETPEASVTPPALTLLAKLWQSTPLSLLLEAANARVLDSEEIDDEWFMGAAVQRKDGRMFFVMPPNRPEVERDTIVRDLMARMLRVPLPGMTPTGRVAA